MHVPTRFAVPALVAVILAAGAQAQQTPASTTPPPAGSTTASKPAGAKPVSPKTATAHTTHIPASANAHTHTPTTAHTAATRRRTTTTAAARAARARAASASAATKAPPAALPGPMTAPIQPSIAPATAVNLPRSVVAPDTMPHKLISAEVKSGIFEYDGMVGKVHLDYKIKDQGYLYFFVPNVGTVVVSLVKLPGFTYVHHAIRGNVLNFSLNGHSYQLSSADPLMGKGEKQDVYVRLDPAAQGYDRFPEVGFGNSNRAPFRFPASLPENQPEHEFVAPIPAGMLPRVQNTVSTTVPGKP